MNSILQSNKRCWVCGITSPLHLHHVVGGSGKRAISDREGLTIWLCPYHHNMSDKGIHFDKELDLRVKQMAQMEWMQQNNKTIEDWIKLFRRNYL